MNEEWEVDLTVTADMTGSVRVTAKSKEEAEEKALEEARNGNVVWKYNGAHDDVEVQTSWRT